VAYVIAHYTLTKCAVVLRDDELEIVGSIELADLLVGRRRDLEEMHIAERVLQPRLPRLTRVSKYLTCQPSARHQVVPNARG
jgi:hypothetical protein